MSSRLWHYLHSLQIYGRVPANRVYCVSHQTMTTNITSCPLFSFGVLADVQYADIPNRLNFAKTSMRYYRNSIKLVHQAALTWNQDSRKPSFAVHLGDLIDGFNNREGKANSEKALRDILTEFDKFDGPVHHILGNHDFYNFTRKELWDSRLNTTQLTGKVNVEDTTTSHNPTNPPENECGCSNKLYYKFNPHPDFCFVVLDTYDISGCSHLQQCPHYEEALKILCAVNKNTGYELNSPTGLEGKERRYVLYNGGVGKEQLQWLRNVLEEATRKQQTVFILDHIPMFGATDQCLLWNYEEVLETLGEFDCVAAILSGHTHTYNYGEDTNGIRHIIFPGIVEATPGTNAFATIDVYSDYCDIRGYGQMPSFTLRYPVCNKTMGEECTDPTKETSVQATS
ncbi:manganese-dependent ADP-ribose/CDP-alcohol diphosphatase-like [Amphiura filiformis]|uniref:manganese-dependent ADP-ribose/CDP-alcohol diphosphatase-like n=1 Tax=Amphiura filiformis TaxID=82378 RepID=UPI003B215B09